MTVNKPKELDWEKVKEQYKDWCFYNKQHLGRMFDSEAFWDFYLKQTLQQQREEIIKEIEGIKRLPNMAQNQNGNEYCSACGCPWDNIDNYCPDCATHNQALVDIIKILENK